MTLLAVIAVTSTITVRANEKDKSNDKEYESTVDLANKVKDERDDRSKKNNNGVIDPSIPAPRRFVVFQP